MGRWSSRAYPASPAESSPTQVQDDGGESANAPSAVKPVESALNSEVTHRYVLGGREKIATFPARGYEDVSGALSSAPSGPLKEYEDKLKAIELQENGQDKAAIAAMLGRSEHWVKRWWRQQPLSIPKPNVRHAPLVRNAPLGSFRDLELRRALVPSGEAVVQELLSCVAWVPARRATRDADTAELRVRFDSSGASMTQEGRFVAEYKGGVATLDRILQHATEVANITDPGTRVFLNRYESGFATCPSHRHDFWTAMISFGADRVAIIEDRAMLLRDGDLLVFGTQSHGCPEMPDVIGRRISVVVFFRPDANNLQLRWGSLQQACAHENQEEDEDEACKHSEDRFLPAVSSLGLVDSNLCGCPGISLGLVSRQRLVLAAPVTIFTIGCGQLKERDLLDRFRLHGIDDVWDIRCALSRSAYQLDPDNLRRLCKALGLRYRHLPLGRAEAGGMSKHLASDEGHDALARMVLAASEGRVVVILGQMRCWRDCERQALAFTLAADVFGPVVVLHIGDEGVEPHPPDCTPPKWFALQPGVNCKSQPSEHHLHEKPGLVQTLVTGSVVSSTQDKQAGRVNRFRRIIPIGDQD